MIKLIDLEVYKSALEIGDRVWEVVDKWDHFKLINGYLKSIDTAQNLNEFRMMKLPIRQTPTPKIC